MLRLIRGTPFIILPDVVIIRDLVNMNEQD